LSCWYTTTQLAFRTAILYTGLMIATCFSGPLAGGIYDHLEGARGIEGWRWLFIVESSVSGFIAIAAFFILPDFPESETWNTRWRFSAEERQIARDRIARDRVSSVAETRHGLMHSLMLAVRDRRTWIFVSVRAKICKKDVLTEFSHS
jgi:MFS family permease